MARWPLLLVLPLAACTPATAPPPPLPRVPVTETMVISPAASDGALHFYRNYFALSEVGQIGRHYELYYLDVEQCHASAVVVAGGIAFTGGDFGGMSSPPARTHSDPAVLRGPRRSASKPHFSRSIRT